MYTVHRTTHFKWNSLAFTPVKSALRITPTHPTSPPPPLPPPSPFYRSRSLCHWQRKQDSERLNPNFAFHSKRGHTIFVCLFWLHRSKDSSFDRNTTSYGTTTTTIVLSDLLTLDWRQVGRGVRVTGGVIKAVGVTGVWLPCPPERSVLALFDACSTWPHTGWGTRYVGCRVDGCCVIYQLIFPRFFFFFFGRSFWSPPLPLLSLHACMYVYVSL